jgi:hypothetical protein
MQMVGRADFLRHYVSSLMSFRDESDKGTAASAFVKILGENELEALAMIRHMFGEESMICANSLKPK